MTARQNLASQYGEMAFALEEQRQVLGDMQAALERGRSLNLSRFRMLAELMEMPEITPQVLTDALMADGEFAEWRRTLPAKEDPSTPS